MKERDVIIACDFNNYEEVRQFLIPFYLEGITPFIKIGMELYYKIGKSVLGILPNKAGNIFLDLKLHDIPTTVNKAMKVLNELPVDLISVHGIGGEKMLAAAAWNSDKCAVVTQLTSNEDIDDYLFHEIMSSISYVGIKFAICPGIRLEDDDVNDQVHTATPKEAKEAGADYIVVGRSITQAKDPVKVYKQICKDFL